MTCLHGKTLRVRIIVAPTVYGSGIRESTQQIKFSTLNINALNNNDLGLYLNSFQALFLAYGPSLKENFVADPFENIEIYNLIAGNITLITFEMRRN